jgi:hypothetical protein
MNMKRIIYLFAIAGFVAVGCAAKRHETSSIHHLTEAQVLAIAKPAMPLSAGESYYLHFNDGVWKVWTSVDGSIRGGWKASTVLTIQDSDGKVLGGYTNL